MTPLDFLLWSLLAVVGACVVGICIVIVGTAIKTVRQSSDGRRNRGTE